jgi:ferredoxin
MTDRPELTFTWQDGRTKTVRANEDQTVLEAAEAADISLPFGCRTGACSTCVGRLVTGTVSYTRPPRALKSRHRVAGYVLCCIARPETDCRIEVGTRVQSELVSNPWK